MTQRDEREKLAELATRFETNQGWLPVVGKCINVTFTTDEARLVIAALRTPADGEVHAEIQRLQDAKRRALAIADERAKENVALRAALASSEGVRPVSFMEAMDIVEHGFNVWKEKPHNAGWFRRIDGTPIPNDLAVNIAEAICDSALRSLHATPEPTDTPDEGPDPLGYAKGER